MADHHGSLAPQKLAPSMIVAVKPSRYTVRIPLRGDRCLAYNTISQAFSVWDQDDMRHWDELTKRGRMTYRARYRSFVQGGYIVNADLDEVENLRSAYNGMRRNDSHLMMTVAPTLSCNFACHYCFQGLDKPLTRMSPAVREAAKVFILRSLKGKKSFHMTWYGGEPLMDQKTIWDISDEVIKYCDRERIKYTSMMISNGYGLTVSVAEKLRKARVGAVQITIDGDSDCHDSRRHLVSGRGTFARIVENIKAVAEKRLVRISIRVNIDAGNESEAERLLGVLQSEGLGVRNGVSVYFAPVEAVAEAAQGCGGCMGKTDYAEAEIRLLHSAFEKGLMACPRPPRFLGMCTAVKPNSYVIVPTGDLHKCWDTVMDPTRRVGSIIGGERESDTPTEALWNEWSPFENSVCSECVLLPSCAGACAFKFVHNDYASGEAARLPCPSLKFNLSEQLFLRARLAGFVREEEWDPERSPTIGESGMLTGKRHSFVSVAAVHGKLRNIEMVAPPHHPSGSLAET